VRERQAGRDTRQEEAGGGRRNAREFGRENAFRCRKVRSEATRGAASSQRRSGLGGRSGKEAGEALGGHPLALGGHIKAYSRSL